MERTEFGRDTKAEIELFAGRMEGQILEGAERLIEEEARLWLKGLCEKKGIRLDTIADKVTRRDGGKVGTLTAETRQLEMALGGREELIGTMRKIFCSFFDDDSQEDAFPFVRDYIESHTDQEGLVIFKETDSDIKRSRLEAAISATHRLLKIVAAPDEEKAMEVQTNKFTSKFLRERVLRSAERERGRFSVNPNPVVPRITPEEEKVIRRLPMFGIQRIFKGLLD